MIRAVLFQHDTRKPAQLVYINPSRINYIFEAEKRRICYDADGEVIRLPGSTVKYETLPCIGINFGSGNEEYDGEIYVMGDFETFAQTLGAFS